MIVPKRYDGLGIQNFIRQSKISNQLLMADTSTLRKVLQQLKLELTSINAVQVTSLVQVDGPDFD